MAPPYTRKSPSPCRPAELGFDREGAIHMAPLLHLPQILSDHGLDADAVIREVGCDPALFQDPDNTIDFTAVGRLFDHMAAVTGSPHPGLELGRRTGLDALGALGRTARLAPDLGTALHTLIRHFHLHDRGAILSLWETESQAILAYTLYCPDVPGTDHIYDAALAIAINLLRELAGKEWTASEVHLLHDRPKDMRLFRQHFRTHLRFRAEYAAIVFPITDLVRPLPTADPIAYSRALRELADMDTWGDDALIKNRVLRLLHKLFIAGSGADGVDLHRIARLFSLHPRSLGRRLRAEGTTFNELLNQTRYQIARQLLRDTRLQIRDIAATLGYADSASFDHAFRRWSGSTATHWRSLQK